MAELRVRVGVDGTGFQAGMAAIERRAQKFNTNLAGTIGKSFAAGAVLAGARSLTNFAGKFEDMAKASGTTAENMQAIAYAAKLSGGEIEDFQTAMRNLAAARKDALESPTGDKAAAFGSLGISVDELRGLKDMGQLLMRVSDGVKKVNVDANSLPVILSLVGARNIAVLPAMKEGLREAADEAQRLNLIMGKGTTGALDAVGDRVDTLFMGLRKIGADLLVLLVKPFTTIYTSIMQIPAAFELMGGQLEASLARMEIALSKFANKTGWGKDLLPALNGSNPEASLKKAEARIAFAKAELERLSNEHADIYDTKAKKDAPLVLPDPEEEIKKAAKEKEESGHDFSREKNPFSMSADSATKIGGFIGGTSPGIIADILGRQQLATQQRIERNTAELLNWMKSRNFSVDDGSL